MFIPTPGQIFAGLMLIMLILATSAAALFRYERNSALRAEIKARQAVAVAETRASQFELAAKTCNDAVETLRRVAEAERLKAEQRVKEAEAKASAINRTATLELSKVNSKSVPRECSSAITWANDKAKELSSWAQ